MATNVRRQIFQDLQDDETRLVYGEEMAKLDFAVAVAKARKESGLTQGQLAGILDVKQPYIARLESGEANPTIGQAGKTFAAMWHRMTVQPGPLMPQVSPRVTPRWIEAGGSGR